MQQEGNDESLRSRLASAAEAPSHSILNKQIWLKARKFGK